MLVESSFVSEKVEEFNVESVGSAEFLLFPDDLDFTDCRLARPSDDWPRPWVWALDLPVPDPELLLGLSDRPRKKVIIGRRIQINFCNGFLVILFNLYISSMDEDVPI